jgi:hypothetical protein
MGSLADLLDSLRSLGLVVVSADRSIDHVAATESTKVFVESASVFVYQFTEAAVAQAVAASICADVYSKAVAHTECEAAWKHHGGRMAAPHVYVKGRVIVVAGDDPLVVGVLDTLLGSPLVSMSPR